MSLTDEIRDREYGKFADSGGNPALRTIITTGFALRIAYDGTGYSEYIGEAEPGSSEDSAAWRIKKLVYSGASVIQVLWADGNSKFDNVWTGHDTLISYS